LNFIVLPDAIAYTGKELRSGWVRERTGLDGDAAAAFVGPCRVDTEDLVDMEDAEAGAHIEAALMAHIIVEHPGCPLSEAVLRQRLLVCILCDMLGPRIPDLRRDGDDVYIGERKLTVSIAAPSPVSSLIHLGINVDPGGAPVPAAGLEAFRVDAAPLLQELLGRYRDEIRSCGHAAGKVRKVQ